MPTPKTTRNSKKKAAAPKPRDVIYPVLVECATLCRDEFWNQFYHDLAAAKPTKGIYISHGVISSSNRRNGFQYSIAEKAPEVIVAELHQLITTHTSICSRKDATRKRALVQELRDELENYDQGKWTAIKRKNLRTMLLVDYAVSLQREHNLSWNATISGYRTILGAFESKTHSSKDVSYEDGKVLSIDDIEISSNGQSIINSRTDEIDSEACSKETEKSSSILLQSLFQPYMSAWLKTIK